ncbi:hypothetical protein MTO96_033593 [Rhipicephalus appendiculatus]
MEAIPYVPSFPPPPPPDHLSPTSEVEEPVSQPGATILTIVMCVCLGVMISLLTVLAFTTAEIAYSRIVSRLIFRSANDNFLMQRQVCSKRQ